MAQTLETTAPPENAPQSPVKPEELPVEERVANGMAFLDERVPGWRARIDLETLNIRRCSACVLGQVFGDYFDGREQLRTNIAQDVRLGFMWDEESSSELTAAWKSRPDALGDPAARRTPDRTALTQ